jgi:hypothetical protein
MYIFQNLATEILFKTLKFHQFEKKKKKRRSCHLETNCPDKRPMLRAFMG